MIRFKERGDGVARRWAAWLAALIGGATVGVCILPFWTQLRQRNLEPTLLLQSVSALLIGLGFALPWLLIQSRKRHKR